MTGQVILFLGPTLAAAEVSVTLDATVAGPAAHGDLLAAAQSSPSAIGLVDGAFERVPAVWHKEILWALSRGVRVYGAASMGALRAAELAPFGMVGVGVIFEAFRDGVLESDDEVAVRHASAEHGYRAASEALVDIRATLASANAAGVITGDLETTLVQLAKDLHYPDRIYPRLLTTAREHGVDHQALAALECWLPAGRLSQKQTDARALIHRVAEDLSRGDSAPAPAHFVRTSYWDHTCRELEQRRTPLPDLDPGRVVDELRLDPPLYDLLRRTALLRQPRHAREERDDLDRWIYAELRDTGRLPAIESRVRDKQRLLDLHPLPGPAVAATIGLDLPTLLDDHARACGLAQSQDIHRLAAALDLPSASVLQRLLVDERQYQRILRGEGRPDGAAVMPSA